MAAAQTRRAAIYARVSTFDQTTENQIMELRRYVETRGWTSDEYVDEGVSGSTDHRPALDKLLRDAKRRRFDVLVYWRLDRLGRNLKHLILFLEELHALGVDFVSLAEGIDATTPAGRLQMHILGAIAEFERARIAERVRLGLQRVRAQRADAGSSEDETDGATGRGAEEARRRQGGEGARSLQVDSVSQVVSKTRLSARAFSPWIARRSCRPNLDRTCVTKGSDRVKSRRQECLGSISQRRVTTAFGKMRHGTHIRCRPFPASASPRRCGRLCGAGQPGPFH